MTSQGGKVKKRYKRKKLGAAIIAAVKPTTNKYRLGNLMVVHGHLTTRQLSKALTEQKSKNRHLGKILVEQHLVSRSTLYKTLAKQMALRCMAAIMTLMLSYGVFGLKDANAGSFKVKDIPAQIRLANTANKAFDPVERYPALFGAEERESKNLKPFTKWTDMFNRLNHAIDTENGQKIVQNWKRDLSKYKNLPLGDMAVQVNNLINSEPYIVDNKNWNMGDYWETPIEFFSRGGDCEDFAIAKYISLMALGVPEDRLRIAIVHDKQKDIPHAVLILYTDDGAMILDNQEKNVVSSNNIKHYNPIFSINRHSWWLHTKPRNTVVASAR
jgi:predicted transglutaminase-like cysteine proteinase